MGIAARPVASSEIVERLDRLPLGGFHLVLVVSVFAGLAFDHMDQVVLSFVIPQYSREWGLTPGLASINPTTGLAGTFVGALVWGMLADRIGRKRTLLITLSVFSTTMLINGFAFSFPQLVLVCIVMGSGVGGTIPLAFTLLAEYTPSRYRGSVMVLVGILSLVGGYLIASIGAFVLLPAFGWRVLFLLGVLPVVVLPIIAAYVPESPRYLAARGRVDEARRIVERLEARAGISRGTAERSAGTPVAATEEQGSEGTITFRNFGRLWGRAYRGRTLMLWSYAFAFGFFTFGFLTWLPTVLRRAGFPESSISFNATVMDLFAVPSAIVAAALFFAWSTRGTLVVYPLTAGLAMLTLSALVQAGVLSTVSLLIVGGTIFAFGTILLGLFGPYSSEVYPTAVRGTGSGWATGMSRLGALSAIPVGGLLLTAETPLFYQQILFGVPLIVAAAIMLAFGIETRRRRLEELAVG